MLPLSTHLCFSVFPCLKESTFWKSPEESRSMRPWVPWSASAAGLLVKSSLGWQNCRIWKENTRKFSQILKMLQNLHTVNFDELCEKDFRILLWFLFPKKHPEFLNSNFNIFGRLKRSWDGLYCLQLRSCPRFNLGWNINDIPDPPVMARHGPTWPTWISIGKGWDLETMPSVHGPRLVGSTVELLGKNLPS